MLLGQRFLAPAGLTALQSSTKKSSLATPRTSTLTVRGAHDGDGGASSSSSSVPDSVPLAADSDWRAFRARLVASTSGTPVPSSQDDAWAHPIPSPEPGCLLLSTPLFFQSSQQYFNQAVILIIQHGANGTAGLILNKPSIYKLGELRTKGSSNLGEAFDPCRLYLGGDVGERAINILHSIPNVDHAQEMTPGLFIGGFEGVRNALATGQAQPEDVKVLTMYCGWRAGQLEDEIRRGVWQVAAASRHFALQQVADGGDDGSDGMWHRVLQLMGGEFAKLSAAMVEDLSGEIAAAAAASAAARENSAKTATSAGLGALMSQDDDSEVDEEVVVGGEQSLEERGDDDGKNLEDDEDSSIFGGSDSSNAAMNEVEHDDGSGI